MSGEIESTRFWDIVDAAVDASSRVMAPRVNDLTTAAWVLEYQVPDEMPPEIPKNAHETISDWLNGRTEKVARSRRPKEAKEILTERLLRAKVAQITAVVFADENHFNQEEATRAGFAAFKNSLRSTKPPRKNVWK